MLAPSQPMPERRAAIAVSGNRGARRQMEQIKISPHALAHAAPNISEVTTTVNAPPISRADLAVRRERCVT